MCVCVCDLIELDVARASHVFPASALWRSSSVNPLQKTTRLYNRFIIQPDKWKYTFFCLELYQLLSHDIHNRQQKKTMLTLFLNGNEN